MLSALRGCRVEVKNNLALKNLTKNNVGRSGSDAGEKEG
jgi:hypothetical protein